MEKCKPKRDEKNKKEGKTINAEINHPTTAPIAVADGVGFLLVAVFFLLVDGL